MTRPAVAQSGDWTWMSGNNTPFYTDSAGSILDESGQPGVYGTLGVPSTLNLPGVRQMASMWADPSGNVWVFGGFGNDGVGNSGVLNDLWKFNPATSEWTWMAGSSTIGSNCPATNSVKNCGQPGVYGTKGKAASGNTPGGRETAVAWTDKSGNLWLFGGSGIDAVGNWSYMNDLWEFDTTKGQWTWKGGSSTCDVNGGQPGIYGTQGKGAAANIPGGRFGAVGTTDSSGNFWLFGGVGEDSVGVWSWLNDLWEYSTSTGQWTWVAGYSTIPCGPYYGCFIEGTYGTQGVAAAGNAPGGRSEANLWVDSKGRVWIFGGWGVDAHESLGSSNDLWQFTPTTGLWTWMNGSSLVSFWGLAVYGTQGVPMSANAPGLRHSAVNWIDASDHLWLFGGWGLDSPGNEGFLNDLWEYNAPTNQWVWIGGAETTGMFGLEGVYGQLGVPDATNIPSGRGLASAVKDKNGDAWVFGGQAVGMPVGLYRYPEGYINDLWRYQPPLPGVKWPAPTTTTVTASPNPATWGQNVTLTAKVTSASGTPPDGEQVAFEFGQDSRGYAALKGGTATYTTQMVSEAVVAAYPGDTKFAGSSATVNEVVNFDTTTTTLNATPSPGTAGQPVTLTATVTSKDTLDPNSQFVTFWAGTGQIGLAFINSAGVASTSTTSIPCGSNSLAARFYGSGATGNSTSNAVTEVINCPATKTEVTSSLNPAVEGQSVTFTATVTSTSSGTPTGRVTFNSGSTTIGIAGLSGGIAKMSTSTLPGGSASITAVYSGDIAFTGSTSAALSQSMSKASTTTTVASTSNPSGIGQTVEFTATVTSQYGETASGTVTFSQGKTSLGSVTLSGGKAVFATSTLPVGTDSVVASYGGNSSFSASTGSLSQVVNKTATTTALTSSLNPSSVGKSVTFTATVSGQGGSAPTGSVTFYNGSAKLGTANLSNETATYTTTTLPGGTDAITAVYGGDTSFNSSTSTAVNQVVNKDASAIALAASPNPGILGQTVTLTATVTSTASGKPTGTVTFNNGNAKLGTGTISTGKATYATSMLPVGTAAISAVYGGDSTFSGSNSTTVHQVVNLDPTTTTLASSKSPSAYGQALTFAATVASTSSGKPSGTVTFTAGNNIIGTGQVSNGKATLAISNLAVGTALVTAAYSGDASFAASTSKAVSQAVTKATTTTTIASSLNPSNSGQSVTFTATVTGQYGGTPTGTVTFLNGKTALGTGTLSGNTAAYSTAALPVGTDSITAVYGGDASYATSTSKAVSQVVKQAPK